MLHLLQALLVAGATVSILLVVVLLHWRVLVCSVCVKGVEVCMNVLGCRCVCVCVEVCICM